MNYGIAIYVEIYGDSLSFLHMKSHVVELFAPSGFKTISGNYFVFLEKKSLIFRCVLASL